MVARLVKFSGADPARRDEVIEWVRDRVLPTLESQDGFAGYIGLYDGDRRLAGGLTLWESREAAETADANIGGMRQETVAKFGLTIESANLWEAPVVDIRTAVHA
jgi:hypothetical protein